MKRFLFVVSNFFSCFDFCFLRYKILHNKKNWGSEKLLSTFQHTDVHIVHNIWKEHVRIGNPKTNCKGNALEFGNYRITNWNFIFISFISANRDIYIYIYIYHSRIANINKYLHRNIYYKKKPLVSSLSNE